MKTYACILEKSPVSNEYIVPCGSFSYVQLDGRLGSDSLLNEAIEHFTKTQPTAKAIAIFKAPDLGSRGRVVATFPYGCERVFEPAVNRGVYK